MTWWATCLCGRKIAPTTITMARRPMAQPGSKTATATAASSAAVLERRSRLPPLGGPQRGRLRLPGQLPRLPAGADASDPLNLCHFVSWGFGGEALVIFFGGVASRPTTPNALARRSSCTISFWHGSCRRSRSSQRATSSPSVIASRSSPSTRSKLLLQCMSFLLAQTRNTDARQITSAH